VAPIPAIPGGAGAAPFVVRPLEHADLPGLVALRGQLLEETASLEPRLRLAPDALDRLPGTLSTWVDQDRRVTVVGRSAVDGGHAGGDLLGYATGLYSIWPPVWRSQRVGEVGEVFVRPELRRRGRGRLLVQAVLDGLSSQGADVLRAPVAARLEGNLGLLRTLGFTPVLRVFERAAPAAGER